MTTMVERSRQARTGLDRARLANLLRQQISALQARSTEWSDRCAKRDAVKQQWIVVQARLGTQLDVDASNASAKALASQARTLLELGNDVQALSADHLWVKLLNSADAANAAASEAVDTAWREYVAELGVVEAPVTLEARVLRTPAARESLEQYKRLYTQYLRLIRREALSESTALEQLARCVREIREVQAVLTVDAPEQVRIFFKSVDEGGATIDQLSPEVLDWLRAHDDVKRFVVKLKAVMTWR